MLELRGIRARRGGAEVLHSVDLTVDRGEVVGVIGPNGAGKSSLLRVICGLLRPRAGAVIFERRQLVGLAPEEIARAGISLVPEDRQIFGGLSVLENLRLAARSAAHRDQIGGLLERFPTLGERAGQRAERLSGGEQQQLAIARALVSSPRLLVLDEPSMGVAPKMIDRIYAELEALRVEGLTMLLVEQSAGRAIEFCGRTAVLSRGTIRAEGTREELNKDPGLLQAYLGRSL